MRSRVTSALLLLCSCARPAPVVEPGPDAPMPEPEAPIVAETPAAEPEPEPRYQLPSATTSTPSWVQGPGDAVITPSRFGRNVAFLGANRRLAIFETLAGYLIAHVDDGIVGTIAGPKSAWAAINGFEGVVLADADGTLSSFPSWQAANERRSRTELGRVPGARIWDIADQTVVAATADAVFVSHDDGRHFAPAPAWTGPTRGLRVFARSDRTVVAQARGLDGNVTRVLPRKAKAWQEAPGDLDVLHKVGDWIGEANIRRCGRVLARDGKRWVDARYTQPLGDWRDWTSLSAQRELSAALPMPRVGFPAAPVRARGCPGEGSGGGGFGIAGMGNEEPIRGTTGPRPKLTARWFSLWSDGSCKPDREDPEYCAEPIVAKRQPHVAAYDEADRRLRVRGLPKGCKEVLTLHTVAGAGVLRCRVGKKLGVWLMGPEGAWHEELHIIADAFPETTTVASDGTMLLHGACANRGPCASSWLRAPAELGGAWTELADRTALAYRVLPGGRALKIGGDHEHGYDLTIVDTAGADPQPVVAGLGGGEETLRSLEIRDEREITLRFSEGPDLDLAADASLVELVPHKPPATPGRVVYLHDEMRPRLAGIGDFDGDGLHDFAVERRDENMGVYLTIVKGREDWTGFDREAYEDGNVRVVFDVPGYSIDDLAGLGDFDGDGRDDFVVTRTNPVDGVLGLTGEAYVVLGAKEVSEIRASQIRKGKGGVWVSGFPTANPWMSWAGPLGDVDGDGRADVGLGFPLERDDAGSLFVLRGKENTAWVHLRDLSRGIGGFELQGGPGEAFGHSAAVLGDFDGDRSGDVAVFAEADATPVRTPTVYVVRGGKGRPRTSGLIADRVKAGDAYAITPGGAGAIGGIAAAGDFDGDGLGDLLVRQPGARGGDIGSGRVLVVFGDKKVPTTLAPARAGTGGRRIDGEFAFDELGGAAAGVGDLDGDGKDDIVLGAAELSRGGDRLGRAYIVHGRGAGKAVSVAGLPGAAVLAAGPTDEGFGEDVVPLGDIDGDERPDFAVTAVSGAGRRGRAKVMLVLSDGR